MNIIAINGAPLANRITGIERYMYEVLKRLDKIIDTNKTTIYLLCPENTELNLPMLNNIKIQYLKGKGKKISIAAIRKFLKEYDATYCTMSGNLCIQMGAIVCTHDIRPWIYKEYDPLLFRIKCAINFLSSKFLSGQMVTVSETSKEEISMHLNVPRKKITVIPNGWEHINDINEDLTFWDSHKNIKKGEYYYSLGSQAPHKNFKWILQNAKNHPNDMFVVAGKVWEYTDNTLESSGNVVYLGYVSDEENKTLMKNCKAFIHPSKYEGFGIPPLEALACGAKIYVSKASCLPEIFKEAAVFFDPDDYQFKFDDSFKASYEDIRAVLDRYSWTKAAEKWNTLFGGKNK